MKFKFKFLFFTFLLFILTTSVSLALDKSDELLNKLETAPKEDVPSILIELSETYLDISPNVSIQFAQKALDEMDDSFSKELKVDALNNLAMANYLVSDYNTSIDLFNESNSLALNLKYKKGLGISQNGLGLIFNVMGDLEKSNSYFLEALNTYRSIDYKKGIAQVLINIGSISDSLGDYENALKNYMEALDINIEIENKEDIGTCLNNIGYVNQSQGYYTEAFNYYLKALKASEDIKDNKGIGISLNNIAQVYVLKEDFENALNYLFKALDIYTTLDNKKEIANTFNNIAYIYEKLNTYDTAIEYYSKALQIREEIQDLKGIINSNNNIGTLYYFSNDLSNALKYHKLAYDKALEINYNDGLLSSLENLAFDYKKSGNLSMAFDYYEKYNEQKDNIFNLENRQIIAEMENKYESEKQQMKIDLLAKENKMNTFKYWTQLIISIFSLIALAIVGFLTFLIKKEKKKSEQLLLNVLPQKVANDLKNTGKTEPEIFDNVTVYFSDIVGFTKASSSLDPKFLIEELNDMFTNFDNIMEKYNCERIKTIGDAYLAIAGLYDNEKDHAKRMINASNEILHYLDNRNSNSDIKWHIRIGLHSGKVVGGVVGIKKYIYDVFGDTINTASRMESNSDSMMINVSQTTHDLTKDDFTFIKRDAIHAKGKGYLDMYFVNRF